MRVFVTGATGFIGSALIPQLIAAGHQVTGLARSEASAAALRAAGADVQHGSVDDLKVLKEAAASSDGVIHLAFRHDIAFSGGYQEAAQSDLQAVETLGEALVGTDKPLVIASGLMGMNPGHLLTEQDNVSPNANPMTLARAATAQKALEFAGRGVRVSVVRMAPTNHGEGDHGFISQLINTARQKGVSGYIGDGTQRWPATHRLDTARLFQLALEKAPAGSVLHGAAENVSIKDIAETIGRHLNIPVQAIAPEKAFEHFSFLAGGLMEDNAASSELTRELVGWQPQQPGLIADLDQGHYFQQNQ